MIEKLEMTNFTVFKNIKLDFCPGVNIFIGENGTGKTHILKLLYSVLDSHSEMDIEDALAEKLNRVFLPKDMSLGRLVRRVKGSSSCKVTVFRDGKPISIEFTSHSKDKLEYHGRWKFDNLSSNSVVYIPVKEMLANAPGFRSLYSHREIYFEEIYYDVLNRAYLPILRGPIPVERNKLLFMLQKIINGKVVQKGEQFFLKNQQGELEFTLLAEGIRKFALLWLLIQNGTLLQGSTLFWDEPEANINPSMIQTLVEIMLHLQSLGIQIFVATHSYVVLREFELQSRPENKVRYFAMKYSQEGDVVCQSGETYNDILPNKISDAYLNIYDKEVEQALNPKQ